MGSYITEMPLKLVTIGTIATPCDEFRHFGFVGVGVVCDPKSLLCILQKTERCVVHGHPNGVDNTPRTNCTQFNTVVHI